MSFEKDSWSVIFGTYVTKPFGTDYRSGVLQIMYITHLEFSFLIMVTTLILQSQRVQEMLDNYH